MTDQPLFPIGESTAPAVLLGSGPGPAPTSDELAMAPYPPIRCGLPPHFTPAAETYSAVLLQIDRETGLRGWMLQVHHGPNHLWRRHHFSRAGLRPPLIDARTTVLQTLGYEPVDGAHWSWTESTTLDQKQVQLAAILTVRQLQHHRESEAAL